MNNKVTEKQLIDAAFKAMRNSHSPHSKFKVGTALLTKGGKVFNGTNIEFDAFSLTVCAERCALFNAISNGEKKLIKLAIAANSNRFKFPCGMCRQALAEFNPNLKILLITKDKNVKRFILKDIIPNIFKL